MQQSKAEDRYSCETLLSMNTLYDHEHHLTQADVDAANALVRHIERTRNPRVPQVGDRVRYTTRHGDFHGNALIEAVREDGTRLGPLRRLRQRSRPVLRRGAVVGIPGTGIALRRFLDREMA